MADATVIVEGKIKFREGKKWKPRWCILKKPSPVADRLQVYLYKDLAEFAKNESKPKSVFALDGFFGLDAGFAYDRELHVLALICHKNISLMAFELRENMIQFEIKIRQNMGEEHQFPVKVVKAPSSARLPKDPIRLMIHGMRFCLIAHVPPKILIAWNIEDLRRFGTREGKFCFEGGTRCGKGSGVFALQSEQAEDIADIVNLASTGKLVNCHRKFKNRSSQIDFNSHLIADMSSSPSSSSIRHPHHPDIASRAAPQGALPVTLNCCHDSQTGSAESEDWSWYKRHSVSVMDHRRITALREKGFTDNREQLAVGIYDVPPKQERRIDDNSWDNLDEPNYSYPRPDPETLCTASSSSTSICSTPTSNAAVLSCGQYGNYKRIVPTEREYANSDCNEQRQTAIYKWQSASTELLDAKVSNLDEMLAGNGQKDSSCKNSLAESLRHLKKQESDLQMEMVLLDEILQNCSVTSLEFSDENSHSETHGAVKQHLSELGPDQKLKDISSEPVMSEHSPDFTIISGNISSLKPAKSDLVHNSNFRKLDRTAVLKLNTSMPEGTPGSPLFYAKFNNIPPTSPLNAPLPYVNLSRYDDESYSHVHLPGSADSAPVVRMPSMQVLHDGQNHGLHHRNFSLTSLQTPTSTSNLVDIDYQTPGRNQMPQHRIIDRAALFNSNSSTQVHQWEQTDMSKHDEILVVKMNNQPEYTDHNVYKSRQPLLHNYVGISHKVHSDIVNILTTDAKLPENDFCSSDIYENLPLRNDNTLPPELPPKGPALLKRLKNSNKCAESEKTNQLMRYQHSQDVRKDADTRKYRADGHAHHMFSDKELQTSTDTREDNYLIMGSPKIKHKELTLKPNASFDTSFSAGGNHCENTGAVKNELYGTDVMCVGRFDCSHDDEIYLDMESNQELCPKDLYICEADLKLSPVANIRMLGESTYMEMANVASKKNLLVKQVATPQRLMVNMAHSEENAYFISSPLSHVPPPPPRPLSLKIRHNSDSGVPPKSHEFSAPDEHKDNRPKDKPIKSPTRVYTKIKKTSQQGQVSEPPMPFPNLIDFSKKMSDSRSTYVNTCLDADKNLVPQEVFISRDVPLPEPVKEGFLARFKRRSSRDKNAAQANEKYANIKIRNSVLERSMSEHDSSKATKEEKSSRLKVGRRRSSSFPNQLSYQESLDTASDSMLKQAASSSSSFSSASSRPKPDQSESPSFRDFSDDSDMSPLLKRGDKSIDQQQLTVLHVRRSDQYPISTYIQACKSPIKINQLYADSSKTDDEKLIEIIQQSKKPVVYQRSSSLELKKSSQEHEQGCYLKLPVTLHRKERRSSFEKTTGYSSSVDSDIPYTSETTRSVDNETSPCSDRSKVSCLSSLLFSLDKEQTPPALPPKTRPYQGPLSPVIEIAPLIPVQTEPIYVEMDKFVSSTDVGASREKAHTANHNRPAEEDKDCHPNISKVETKAGRLSQVASYDMSNEISYNSVIVCVDTAHLAQCDDGDEAPSDISPTACTLSHHIVNVSDISECTNLAKSILRPRSGQEYVFIQRISVTSPISFSCLPTNSSFVNSVFSELQKPNEELFHSYHPDPPCAISSHNVSSHYLSLPHNTPQKSPSTSSGKETARSSASMHSSNWEPDPSHHRYDGRPHAKAVNDSSSQASTPHPVFSPHPALSVSPTKWKSANTTGTEDSIFFPVYMTFSATTPPSSPLGPYAHTSSAQHTPTYVNQEFVDRHNHASSSSHTVNTGGSHSSNSPIRAGVHSLKSLIFKDSSRHSPRGSKDAKIRSRHSESDANKVEKLSISLPSSKHNQASLSSSVQRSHSDPKRSETEDKLQLPSEIMSSSFRESPHKVYDKFAESSIISRRRRRHIAGNKLSAEAALINSSAESSLKDISQEHSPVLKSSGYKNIDCINAATMAAISSPSPRTPSSGSDTLHLVHASQLRSIQESHVSLSEVVYSSGSSVFVDRSRHSTTFVFSGGGSDTADSSVPLPHSSSPPPPIPWRKQIPSSPVSSCSLNSAISSSDVSDSPPSYFAPSPPCTPPPPPLPPRMPQSSPIVVVTSNPIEPDTVSHFSDEEQELNYIEIDMTKSTDTVVLPPPLGYSRRSKRVRQQKEKDYAKLRYAVIDHRATKALQQARQEHEQCRDSSLWHVQPKDANLERGAGHLSRINSAPASSKRKQISVIQRERKLSSGSIESC